MRAINGDCHSGAAGGWYDSTCGSAPMASASSATGLRAAGGIELTTAWGVNAAYEHFWNKRWQTSVYGAYTATSYNTAANSDAVRC